MLNDLQITDDLPTIEVDELTLSDALLAMDKVDSLEANLLEVEKRYGDEAEIFMSMGGQGDD